MITERIDRITLVTDTNPVQRAPKSVKVELVGRCNYRCGFCALRMREHQPTQDMDFALFTRLVREMRDFGVEELGLFYLGESAMNPDLLVAACQEAKRVGFPYVFLTTNGSRMTPALTERLMQAGLDSLKFSINAASDEQFAQVMAVAPRLYHQAIANLQAARRIRDAGGYACGLYASSIQFDGEQQEQMEALLKAEVLPYVDEHYWLPLYSMGSFASQREAELGYKPIAGNQGRLGALRSPLPCWSVFTEGHITHDGKLSACCFDACGTWAMADLTEVDFATGWNSPAFVALRGAHQRQDVTGTPCEGCLAYA